MKIFFLMLFILISLLVASVMSNDFISIRGHSPVQRIPFSLTSSFPIWTFENGRLFGVESHLDGTGWVNPTTIEGWPYCNLK